MKFERKKREKNRETEYFTLFLTGSELLVYISCTLSK